MKLQFALLLVASAAFAQAPHETWRTITTAHFRVHYPVEYDAWARRAAGRLESVRDAVVAEVGFAPEQTTDVLVVNPIAEANGETLPLLDAPRIVLFAEPPGPETQIGEYSDWIDLLSVHETAHLVHLLRPSRNPFERFAERFLPLNPITLRAPRWVLEGYATVIEGRITGSGRPSGSLRAAILRKWALEGHLPTYSQLNSDHRFLGMSMAYLAGSAFLEWLEQRSGPDAMRHLWARLTARQRRAFGEAFAGVYGDTPEHLYGRFTAELTERAVALAHDATFVEGDLWQETSRGSGDPAVSPDGKQLAMVLRDEKGEAKLVVFSTEKNEEEEKAAKRIEKILERDPQDVAPVRTRPLPRKPLFTLMPPEGGDVEGPRWTPDGKSIVYTHRQPDRDGFLHHDLFRWTPATGANERLTHLADVKSADPLPAGTRAIAVRDRNGLSQLVFVDLSTGAVESMNEPSLEAVYDHPRASRGGRMAWAEHRAGVWRVVVDGKPLPAEGAFAPEWGSDGSLYFAAASHGFVDIARAEGAVTRTSGAALDPAPAPDGSLYFMSLEPDGFVVRRIAPKTLSPATLAERSFVPALPPAPARPVALRTEAVTSRPYGIGRQEMDTLFGGTRTAFGSTTELGLRFGDVVGRLDTLVIGGTHGRAALAGVWRGWPVETSVHLFRTHDERGAELRGRWTSVAPGSRLMISAGALALRGRDRGFLEGTYRVRQRRLASEELMVAADSAHQLRATLRASVRLGGMSLGGALTSARHASVGGVATSIEPESLFIGRILEPVLDRDALIAPRYHGERIELRSGPLTAFWQRHDVGGSIDVAGIETSLSMGPQPLLKAAGMDLIAGVARLHPARKTRAWIALRWRP